jgi:hypothetical protein
VRFEVGIWFTLLYSFFLNTEHKKSYTNVPYWNTQRCLHGIDIQVLYCTVLYCAVLYCTIQQQTQSNQQFLNVLVSLLVVLRIDSWEKVGGNHWNAAAMTRIVIVTLADEECHYQDCQCRQ